MSGAVQTLLRLDSEAVWTQVRDGDPSLRAIYERHYSCRRYRDGRKPKKTVGPGEYIALVTPDARAALVWRKFMSADTVHGHGVNCMMFRNEGQQLSSMLLLAAEVFAWARWPGQRLYTYVDAANVGSSNPGFCFIKAGWARCGLEKLSPKPN